MYLVMAEQLAKSVGIHYPVKAVNFAIEQAPELFEHDAERVDKEVEELKYDAVAHGIKFSLMCGCAIEPKEREHEACKKCRYNTI
jgi:hypothetical protein